ncbi:hypothetical protein JW887_06930 [Candidatus Dojkabacteria bacterium]|nr:hypothetical protein [Candidatus Dojkabacteria bacterium]
MAKKETIKNEENSELVSLREDAEKRRQEIRDAYFELRTGKMSDVRKPRKLRKEYAKILTKIKTLELDNLSDTENNGK